VIVAPLAGADLGQNSAISSHDAASGARSAVGDQAPYFVCVGTIERRKNYEMLLRIWSRLADRFGSQCPKLTVFGQLGPQSASILSSFRSNPKLTNLIRFEIKASDAEIAASLRNARALLMPTHAEGYGLPVIEALQLGTPVIASDIASFREIGQGVPELVVPSEEGKWEAAITRFAFGGEERDRQLVRLEGFVAPSWGQHFSIIEPWLERLTSDREASPMREKVLC
jgi:glycosyltransferase involved in cell wall biosynthesis